MENTRQDYLSAFKENFYVLTEDDVEKLPIQKAFRSNHFALIVCTKGEFVFQHNLIPLSVKKGQACIILHNSLNLIEHISEDFSFHCLAFTLPFLEQLAISLSTDDIFKLFNSTTQLHYELTENEAADLHAEMSLLRKKTISLGDRSDPWDPIKYLILTIFSDFGIIFGKYNQISQNTNFTRREVIVSDFLKLLMTHFTRQRSVTFYANLLFITPRYLSQVTKEVTNKTAGEIIDEYVIREAKILLESPQQNVSMVTFSLGFSDQSFFGKFFKRHTGLSPSSYRSKSKIPHSQPF
ncbi:helix-turn-helix domain-containing protein [Pedobacter sp. MR22-3]|uniref:helix-turn-helix domain-containing protein n=1 Tax=Pedobacter sp. MR22-3 TaxID=2994552 RepID=UPI0022482F2D|nr:helix-turn-helix domain-containing protein [Pedobacter sp. MR22-3]MCX2584427.1 helix-turn-helix domain-containing protein [Pedobacter sp. MR22-3]